MNTADSIQARGLTWGFLTTSRWMRFGSALNLNPHLHALFLDGVYVRRSPTGPLRFVRLRALTDADVAEVLGEVVTGLHSLLIRRGLSDLAEQLSPDDGSLALQQLALGSVAGQSPLGPSPSRHGLTADSATAPTPRPRLCASLAGASLHAATTARRRGDLEVLCRYVLRPPLGIDRVRWREDGLVELSLPRPWSDGTTSLRFEPLTFIGRLVPLVPPALEPLDRPAFAQEFQARVAAREAAIREQMASAGRGFMGAHEVRRQRRDARPKTHELRRGRHPVVASRDRAHRLGALKRLRRFRDAYRAALERWRKRTGPVCFPEGTYKMRNYPGVTSDRAPPPGYQAA